MIQSNTSFMISLYELLNVPFRAQAITSHEPLMNKYYEAMKDKFVDLLDNVHIDITTSNNKSLIRWAIMSDEYANFNNVISSLMSSLIAKR